MKRFAFDPICGTIRLDDGTAAAAPDGFAAIVADITAPRPMAERGRSRYRGLLAGLQNVRATDVGIVGEVGLPDEIDLARAARFLAERGIVPLDEDASLGAAWRSVVAPVLEPSRPVRTGRPRRYADAHEKRAAEERRMADAGLVKVTVMVPGAHRGLHRDLCAILRADDPRLLALLQAASDVGAVKHRKTLADAEEARMHPGAAQL